MVKTRTTLVGTLVLLPLLVFVLWDMSTRGKRESEIGGARRLLLADGTPLESVEGGAADGALRVPRARRRLYAREQFEVGDHGARAHRRRFAPDRLLPRRPRGC